MKKLILVVCAMLLALGAFGIANAAPTISVNPLNDVQFLGATFDIALQGSGFDIGEGSTPTGDPSSSGGTAGGGLSLAWDPAILTLNSVTSTFAGDEFFGNPGTIDNTAGTLTDFSVSSLNGTALADFDIATLNFSADALGLSGTTITISDIDVWADFDGLADMSPLAQNGTVEVINPVPIPGSILLLGSGLVGLIGFARRKMS